LAEYDLASILYDPYVSLTESERRELTLFYRSSGDMTDAAFEEKLRLCAMQRLMQALGAYGYLGHAKGNEAFLAYIPIALDSLGQVLARINNLEPLQRLIAQLPQL
jgi:aminoglycoside/choline kinase family phosphotransferase